MNERALDSKGLSAKLEVMMDETKKWHIDIYQYGNIVISQYLIFEILRYYDFRTKKTAFRGFIRGFIKKIHYHPTQYLWNSKVNIE